MVLAQQSRKGTEIVVVESAKTVSPVTLQPVFIFDIERVKFYMLHEMY